MKIPMWVLRWLHRHHFSRKRMKGGLLHSWFGDRILARDLWQPTKEAVARAWLVGFPITIIPFLPLQTVFACVACLFVRGNLLLAIALQFLSTPITAPVQIPACYLVGEMVRGRNPLQVWRTIKAAPMDLMRGQNVISLYLGAVVLGALIGAIGYAVIQHTWRHPVRRIRVPDNQPPS